MDDHFLETISNKARENDLKCLLIGGHAVTALGYARSTFDVDLLVSHKNLEAWRRLFQSLGLSLLQFEASPEWPIPAVDLMLVDQSVFDRLFEDRKKHVPLDVPSASALIAFKIHAIYSPSRDRIDQDWSDVSAIMKANDLSLENKGFCSMVESYGGKEALEKIRNDFV